MSFKSVLNPSKTMTTQTAPVSKKALWTGYIMSALPALLLIFSAIMKLMKPATVVEGFSHLGFSEQLMVPLGIVEFACAVIYLIPRTSVLGAILLTGYPGGAVAATARVGDLFLPPVIA